MKYSDFFGGDMYYHNWMYKGHKCIIRPEYYDDVIKLWHEVTTPDGKELFADISPYLGDPLLVEMWIDAGYPPRICGGPLGRADLDKILAMDRLTRLIKLNLREVV